MRDCLFVPKLLIQATHSPMATRSNIFIINKSFLLKTFYTTFGKSYSFVDQLNKENWLARISIYLISGNIEKKNAKPTSKISQLQLFQPEGLPRAQRGTLLSPKNFKLHC